MEGGGRRGRDTGDRGGRERRREAALLWSSGNTVKESSRCFMVEGGMEEE